MPKGVYVHTKEDIKLICKSKKAKMSKVTDGKLPDKKADCVVLFLLIRTHRTDTNPFGPKMQITSVSIFKGRPEKVIWVMLFNCVSAGPILNH